MLYNSHRMKPRVAHLVESLEIGGAERLVSDLVCARGQDSTSVICLEVIGALGEELQRGGFQVDLVGMHGLRIQTAYRLWRLLKERRPDVLHCHNLTAHLFGAAAARLTGGIAVVMTKHGAMQPVGGMVGFLNRKLAHHTQTVAVSKEALDLVKAWLGPESPLPVQISNGISLQPYENLPRRGEARAHLCWPLDSFLIGIVARLVVSKGHLLLVDTFARLVQKVPQAKLLIVGEGYTRPQVEARIRDLALESSVMLLGERHDVPEILAALDVFCLPSETEGMPITLLEAMAASLPVVITRVGAVPSVVDDGVSGLLIPPFDSAALERALLTLAADPQRAATMGRAGRARVERDYSLQSALDAYERLYAEMLARGDSVR